MTINEALRAASEEYSAECRRAQNDPALDALMRFAINAEYDDINQELSGYVAVMAAGLRVPGPILPTWAYQMAVMCFRMGMRTQRKLDHPDEATTSFWRSDKAAV